MLMSGWNTNPAIKLWEEAERRSMEKSVDCRMEGKE
jgi:hypothetical protein